jgi:hypothetical protein
MICCSVCGCREVENSLLSTHGNGDFGITENAVEEGAFIGGLRAEIDGFAVDERQGETAGRLWIVARGLDEVAVVRRAGLPRCSKTQRASPCLCEPKAAEVFLPASRQT